MLDITVTRDKQSTFNDNLSPWSELVAHESLAHLLLDRRYAAAMDVAAAAADYLQSHFPPVASYHRPALWATLAALVPAWALDAGSVGDSDAAAVFAEKVLRLYVQAARPDFLKRPALPRFAVYEYYPRFGARDEISGYSRRLVAVAETSAWAARKLGLLYDAGQYPTDGYLGVIDHRPVRQTTVHADDLPF